MVDITRPETFDAATKWIQDLSDKLDLNVPKLLLLNKCDLIGYEVDRGFIDRYCQDLGLVGWFLVSAKTRTNIEDAISCLISALLYNRTTSHCPNNRLKHNKEMSNKNLRIIELSEEYEIKTEYRASGKPEDRIQPKQGSKTETNRKCC